MARIMNVDYEAMPGKISQMRVQAESLNAELVTAYGSVSNMHNAWYGKRYNALVKTFNELVPKINEMLELVVGDIPFTLETIANNYAQADMGSNITSANKTTPNKITELAMSNEIGMKFLSEEVETIKEKVFSSFDSVSKQMGEIESQYSGIQWESEAAAAFKTRFSQLKNEIISSFESITKLFVTLMEQAMSDIQAAETANTVQ